ncbi:MAG TPA: class A beta-lactamase-related serine hydrolase [Candidatus Corynebacterium avicola]|uniref:Class A beta-lactamase-related serine hydrolase n=1 Tax=Candidatus Corynebacterium avicola TaxID=2838527 RepID=A0A9D1UKS6_9CORY|nr:class A beta-lactamase-related serine hydrolase [Candidatus Corynebacterium avicola]
MAATVAVATPGFAQAAPGGLPTLPGPVNDAVEALDPGQTSSWDRLDQQLSALADEAAADGINLGVSVQDVNPINPQGSVDVGSGEQQSAASVIKLPILATLLHQVDQGKASLDKTITINGDESNIVDGSGELKDRDFPQQLTVGELARLMIQVSDNSATNFLIDEVGGFAPVNNYMASLGFGDLNLGSKMMDPDNSSEGPNSISAAGITSFLTQVKRGLVLTPASTSRFVDLMRGQQVDTKFGAVVPRENLANKTGEIEGASHDSGYILLQDRSVALTATTSFDEGRSQSDADAYVQRAGALVLESLGGTPTG